MTDESKVQFKFTIVVAENGTISTHVGDDVPAVETNMVANTFDIYKVCKEIVSDIEAQLLADRVIQGVMGVLDARDQQAQPITVSDKVADALAARGVTFDASNGGQAVEFSAENAQPETPTEG
jgi:hypothetical protein